MDEQEHYFALFGLRPRFDLNAEELRERYIKLQRQAHPDRFADADPMQRRLAMEQASRINKGYEVLQDPIKRARYLLLLSSGVDALGEQTIGNSAFLMEQMEWRESLEKIGDDQEEGAKMAKSIADEKQRIYQEFGKIWGGLLTGANQDLPTPNQEQTGQLGELAQKMQYLDKLGKELAELRSSMART